MSLFNFDQAHNSSIQGQDLGHESVSIKVRKRNGELSPVNPLFITRAVQLHCNDLKDVDCHKVADRVIRGLYHGVSTEELDKLLIQTAAGFIGEEPEYSKLAARLLNHFIHDEVKGQAIVSFSDSISHGSKVGILSPELALFVKSNQSVLDAAIHDTQSELFEYFGIRTVYDRYLLKDPISRLVFETPQYFFMRVACGLSSDAQEAIAFYKLISSFSYMPSTPTLFNSGTLRSQMSSCYLLDSPDDNLESIYERYKDVALLSKFAGGIGLSYSRVRARGSLIKGTNGKSNGIVPFLKTLDSSVSAVNQGGKRKGAACVYLETWHADVRDFLKLRDNTGDDALRTHNLNTANWIPDLFMKRLQTGESWSLFDPKDVPDLVDLYGQSFEEKYEEYEKIGLAKETIPARELYADMMRCLAQTGNGWMTFKDSCNSKANQVGSNPQNIIHLSNLCTEIVEVTSQSETAVCNLGSINLGAYVDLQSMDLDYLKLSQDVGMAIKFLDRVIDINFYPIPQASASNHKWRPVGLGVMGLQDVFFKLNIPFDSPKAKEISRRAQEEIYFSALSQSVELAKVHGSFASFEESRAYHGDLQFDLWGVVPDDQNRWQTLKEDIKTHGLRNALLLAIAPTATIASICGAYECVEPQISNLFKRETLSGEFLQINKYLIQLLKQRGLWNERIRNRIKEEEGSVQRIDEIPDDIKEVYRTVWEIPMRSLIDMAADRGAYIDQSQSLNLFIENPTIGKLSSMYNYAWQKGLKTTYYLRSRAATKINKATTMSQEAIACSLENPDSCESCQ